MGSRQEGMDSIILTFPSQETASNCFHRIIYTPTCIYVQMVAGRLVNVYSTNDWILGVTFRAR
jgi:hypothetical protein